MKKELKEYLNDLDNLLDTEHFSRDTVKDYTYFHKQHSVKSFVQKGREYIRQYLMLREKGLVNPLTIRGVLQSNYKEKEIHDDTGFTGSYEISGKDILDIIINLKLGE